MNMFRKTNSLFLATITILALATIYNIYGSSDTYAATASLSTTGSVNIDISASGNGANIGTDTLTVNTTCSAGYTIAIKSSTSDAALYKDGDSTSISKINPSSGTLSSPASILGDNIGTWGYSMTDSTISGNFIGLNNTPTIIKNSNTASALGGDSIPVYFGVSIPNSLEPGQYKMANSGTIVYQLTMPIECDPYTIKYNGNNSDAGTTMSVTNKVDENTSTTLMPSNYKRAGYGFAGWNTKADGTGENFGPMEDIVLSTSDAKGNALLSVADANKEITLYAKWIASAGDIQDWDGCSTINVGDVTALTDTRDGNTYAIAKLADGNCWMIENLRLSNTNSDNATGALAQGYGSNFIGLPDPETANFNEDGVANSLYSNDGSTSVTVANTRFPRYNNTNTTNPTTNMTATYQNIYSYGNYYTWPAAAATIDYSATNNYSVETSICPKGWHLPKGGNKDNESNNEFWGLIVDGINNGNKPANYDSILDPYYTGSPEGTGISKLIRQYPNNFIYSGYIQDSWFGGHGTTGDFWAATTDGFGNAYGVAFNLNYITPGTRFVAKYYGRTVRCVADADEEVTIEKAYEKAGMTKQDGYYKMQDMNDSICGAVNVLDEEGQTQLIDARDNKVYWATKLQDGHCWMTQNLDLNLSTSVTLTHDDTDLGWGSDTTTTSWVPVRSTIDASSVTNNYISDWRSDNNTPYSTDPGNVYWNAFPFYASTENNFLNNDWGSDPVKFQKDTPFEGNGTHGHVGNYYNWSAAVASNDTSAYTSSTYDNIANNPQNSICPAGWRLPTMSNASNTTESSTNEFSRLNYLYNSNATNTSEKLESAPLYFARSGYIYGGQNYVGYGSFYQSSTVYSSSYVYYLSFDSSYVSSTISNRDYGRSVRCLAR